MKTLKGLQFKKISMVFPHHGGNVSPKNDNNLEELNKINNIAFISHGSMYGHPTDFNCEFLTKMNFEIKETKKLSLYEYFSEKSI